MAIPVVGVMITAGVHLGNIIDLIPFPKTHSYAIKRGLLNSTESSETESTTITLTISEIRDSNDNSIVKGRRRIYICPGDSVVMRLWMGMGHIAAFEATDPQSGQQVSQTFPTTYKSEVVNNGELTLHIPKDAKPGENIRLPWQAEMYITKFKRTEESGPTKINWFDLVKPVQISRTTILSLISSEERNVWSRSVVHTLLLRFAVYSLIVAMLFGILIIVKKSFFGLISICSLFVGTTVTCTQILSNELEYSFFIWWVAILMIIAVIGAKAKNILSRYHSEIINELRSWNTPT